MPPQAPAPTQIPTGQVNPVMMALLRARAMQGAQGNPVGPAPNGVPINSAAPPPAPTNAAGPMPTAGGAGMPAQQVMKAAAQAQSPLMDQQTRQIAKTLIQKLMQHM